METDTTAVTKAHNETQSALLTNVQTFCLSVLIPPRIPSTQWNSIHKHIVTVLPSTDVLKDVNYHNQRPSYQ